MKFLKAVGTICAAIIAWILTLILLAAFDGSVGHWITDHKLTQAMCQAIIHGVATIVLLKLRANTITAIAFNIAILVMMYIVSDGGMNQLMGIIMMLYLLPIYKVEKERRGT